MIAAAIVGLIGGVLSGLFGVGGGVLFVPGLVLFSHLSQLDAQSTSLVAIVPVALIGAARQRRYGNLRPREGLALGGLSILGVAVGVGLANVLPADALRLGFAALTLYVAYEMARKARAPS